MKAAAGIFLLVTFVVSECAIRVDTSNSQDSKEMVADLSSLFEGLSSSQVQQIYQELEALLSSALESSNDDSNAEEPEDSTAASSTKLFDSTTEESFVQDLLTAHNEYRSLAGVANLTLNSTLSAYALEWAEYLAENSLLEHRSDPEYGENIYWSSAVSSAQAVADAWYSEIADYTDYTTEPDYTSFSSGHYTQMVWKNSKQLGCGAVTASSGAFFVVCNYNPPGNYVGEFVANVLQPSS